MSMFSHGVKALIPMITLQEVRSLREESVVSGE